MFYEDLICCCAELIRRVFVDTVDGYSRCRIRYRYCTSFLSLDSLCLSLIIPNRSRLKNRPDSFGIKWLLPKEDRFSLPTLETHHSNQRSPFLLPHSHAETHLSLILDSFVFFSHFLSLSQTGCIVFYTLVLFYLITPVLALHICRINLLENSSTSFAIPLLSFRINHLSRI